MPALAQVPQHSRSAGIVVPGGWMQLVPEAHIEPTPVHVRQLDEGIGSPQATVPAPAQFGQHVPVAPPVHVVPDAHVAVP